MARHGSWGDWVWSQDAQSVLCKSPRRWSKPIGFPKSCEAGSRKIQASRGIEVGGRALCELGNVGCASDSLAGDISWSHPARHPACRVIQRACCEPACTRLLLRAQTCACVVRGSLFVRNKTRVVFFPSYTHTPTHPPHSSHSPPLNLLSLCPSKSAAVWPQWSTRPVIAEPSRSDGSAWRISKGIALATFKGGEATFASFKGQLSHRCHCRFCGLSDKAGSASHARELDENGRHLGQQSIHKFQTGALPVPRRLFRRHEETSFLLCLFSHL